MQEGERFGSPHTRLSVRKLCPSRFPLNSEQRAALGPRYEHVNAANDSSGLGNSYIHCTSILGVCRLFEPYCLLPMSHTIKEQAKSDSA